MNTMDETNRNSMRLDIEAVRLSENDHDQPTETYKQVSEFNSNAKSTGEHSTFFILIYLNQILWTPSKTPNKLLAKYIRNLLASVKIDPADFFFYFSFQHN